MSGKIELFNKAAQVAASVGRSVTLALGRDGPNNDKHEFTARFVGLAKESWAPIQLQIHMSHGYYGSSSGYSNTSDEVGRYLAEAINKHRELLCDTAVEFAKRDMERARTAAADEARIVLAEATQASA